MTSGRLFVVTGPSGVGKGTLIRRLLERRGDLELSISATTRAPRAGEVDGVDYHFMSEADFVRGIERNDFIEHARYSGSRYGTLRSEVEPRIAIGIGVVLEIELQGARQVLEAMPEATRIFIAPPTPETLRERLEGRGTDSPDQIVARLEVAQGELEAKDEFEHVIVNDDLDAASDSLDALVRSELAGH